jgi:menaquinone-specific isochorismate synthase
MLKRFDQDGPATNDSLENNSIRNIRRTPGNAAWKQQVEQLRSEFDSTFRKIVPAQQRELRLERPVPIRELAQNLRQDADSFQFLVQWEPSRLFAGASPERLVSRRGRTVETESLAGTVEAPPDETMSENLAEELSQSEKNQKEHQHVTDYLRDRIAPLVRTMETVPQTVRSLSTVQHLLTVFRGRLKDDYHVLNLVDRFHPTPAVSGRPSGLATARLKELEDFERGFYAGPVGWFDPDGNGEFTVGIRSTLLSGTKAYTYAGAGIIEDSNAAEEMDELELKFDSINRFLLGTLSGS